MARTETINILKFAELSDSAKEKARQWYREAGNSDEWWDSVYEYTKTVAALMGVRIDSIGFSGFSCQGDGAHFTGGFGYAKGCVKAVRAYASQDTELHRIAQDWQALQARYFYRLTGTISHYGHYQHSNCTRFEVYADGLHATIEAEEAVAEVLRALMDWLYTKLEKESDYLNSDASVDENIKANEYEFTEDGTVY